MKKDGLLWKVKLNKILEIKERKCALCEKIFLSPFPAQIYCGNRKKREGCAYKMKCYKHRVFREKNPNLIIWRNTSRKKKKDILLEKCKYSCNLCFIKNNQSKFFDVDHKDGNPFNNELSNLWILCPNCHRLKTIKQLENK